MTTVVRAVLFLLWSAVLSGAILAQKYDLVLQGGHVLDPRNGVDGVMDVAVAGGKVGAVARAIADADARQRIRVDGLYVTPGLVDLHVHVFHGPEPGSYSNGVLSLPPDGFNLRSGVTTAVDAGGSGWRNFPEFKALVIDRARTRILALLNIVGAGMRGGPHEQNLEDMDAVLTARRIIEYPETIVGVKTAHYEGPGWEPVDRAVRAGTLARVPVMVDFGFFVPERPFQELVLRRLRPGDIYTHMYLGRVPMIDAQGRVFPYLFEARQRGVLFDVGHGGGSFLFRQAVPAVRQGWIPDSISTDLHVSSMMGGMKDMLNVMSKFLNLGLSLQDVVRRSTWHPARAIHREDLGHLAPGAGADIAVLRLHEGKFGFVDVGGGRLDGTRKLECELTLRDGRVVWDLNGRSHEAWEKLPVPANPLPPLRRPQPSVP